MQALLSRINAVFSKNPEKKIKKDENNDQYVQKIEVQTMERLVQFDKYDEKNYKILFEKDEDEAKRDAISSTTKEIRSQIEILIGKQSEWSSNSLEVEDFRRKMQVIFIRNKRKLKLGEYEDLKVDLPRYLVPETEPEPEMTKKIVFLCGVHIDKGEQFQEANFQALDCDINKKASIFLENIIKRANRLRVKSSRAFEVSECVLKVTGANEYIYGDIELFQFDSVRKALKYGKPYIELNLLNKKKELKKLDKYMKKLEKVSYNIDREFFEPVDNDKIKIEKNKRKKHLLEVISIKDIKNSFSFSLKNFQIFEEPEKLFHKIKLEDMVIFVHAEVVHGVLKLGESFSRAVPFSINSVFNHKLIFFEQENEKNLLGVSDLPRESVVLITVYSRKASHSDFMLYCDTGKGQINNKDIEIGSCAFPLIDYKGVLKTGIKNFKLSIGHSANLWSLGEGDGSIQLSLKLDEYCLPVIFPTKGSYSKEDIKKLKSFEETRMYKYSIFKGKDQLEDAKKRILRMTPINTLKEKDKWILWNAKAQLTKYPELLPKFLLSVPWNIPLAVQKAQQFLQKWKPPNPLSCLELLDYKFADQRVRIYAVKHLDKLSNRELFHYILQLAQTLKFELYHDCALSRFLLQRALSNLDIAMSLFWYLKSEMHIPSIRERFGLILEEFLMRCAGFRIELMKQNCVLEQIYKISLNIKKFKGSKKDQLNRKLRNYLKKVKFPKKFKLPLTYRVEVNGINIEKSKVMTSAKLPLFLFFKNVDKFAADNFGVLYKVGDDLKQDVLCLQMLRIMDHLWKNEKMDLHIRAYGCISTGDLVGMLEIVQRSETLADIAFHKGIKKMLAKDTLLNWLKSKNQKSDYDDMRENFMKSCAGYCVATYILGLGDRHNDNVMLSEKGDLFHIDFGHFLNHTKRFLGVKRETTPFVFTPQFVNVLGGTNSEHFKRFEKLCHRAYNSLRKKKDLLIVLFVLMLGSGLVEMQSEKEIKWVENALVLDKTEEESKQFFSYLIKLAFSNKRQVLNDAWHITWHKILN